MKKLFITLLFMFFAKMGFTQTPDSAITPSLPKAAITFKNRSGHQIDSVRYGSSFFATIVHPKTTVEGKEPIPITLKKEDIILIINDRPFPEYEAQQLLLSKDSVKFIFTIDHHRRGDGTNLAKFLGSERTQYQKVQIDIGKRDGTKITTGSTGVHVVFYTDSGKYTVFVVAFLLIISLIILAMRSPLLKDKIDPEAVVSLMKKLETDGTPDPKIPEYRWSLSKTQLALWTLTIAILYFLIWIVIDGVPAINSTVLALLGISFGTTAAASLQSSPKENHAVKKSNILRDLVDDGTGPSIHRFQNLVFVIIFFCIFVGSTFQTLEFPDFDTTQLLLLGISSAGYVGMKFLKENQ